MDLDSLEIRDLLINWKEVCINHPKISTFQKLSGHLVKFILSAVFSAIKSGSTAVKKFEKYQNALRVTHKDIQILFSKYSEE